MKLFVASLVALMPVLLVGSLFGPPMWLWLSARKHGVPVLFSEAIGMHLRIKAKGLRVVFNAARISQENGLGVPLNRIEVQYLVGGDPVACVTALVEAKARRLPCTWEQVAAVELAGRDPVAIVRAGVSPVRVLGAKEYEGRFLRERTRTR